MRVLAALSVSLLLTAGCGAADDPDGPTADPQATTATSSVSSQTAPSELGTIVASGFGQQDEYVWATAVVHNNSEFVGQSVTVNFNVLDVDGAILASEAQVESFYQPVADHAIGTQITLSPGQLASSVEVTLDVQPQGAFSDTPFPSLPVTDVTVGSSQYGGQEASFELTNPLDIPLRSPRVQVVCMTASGEIIGGGSDYPELVPPTGTVRIDAHVLLSGDADGCTVYAGPPIDWDGAGTSESEADSAEDSGSAEEAFRVWVEQFNADDWRGHYDTLVNAQRSVISESDYVDCRSREETPEFGWEKVLSTQDVGDYAIPATDDSMPATKVTVQLIFMGVPTPVDAHMLMEDGVWKWSMTAENVQNCVG